METVDIDDTDERILDILSENARTPDEDIADELGISAEEVSERIDRLLEEDVITSLTAVFDTSKLGYISVAFGFSVEPGKADEIARRLTEFDNIYKLWILSGRHNIVAHANFRDITEFQDFSANVLHDIDGIANYETSIATKSVIDEGSVLLTEE